MDEDRQQKVMDEVERLIGSAALGKQSRLPALLQYLVKEEMEGRGDRLKAYTVGIDVLGKGEDFDPNNDSIVRVEFRRLRQTLEHHYATAGSASPVRITIPLGGYRPEFEFRTDPGPVGRAHERRHGLSALLHNRRGGFALGAITAATV